MSSQETLTSACSPAQWPGQSAEASSQSREEGPEGADTSVPLPGPGSYSEGVRVGVRTRVCDQAPKPSAGARPGRLP